MAIRGNTPLRNKLKEVLDISDPTFYRLITDNAINNDLTKASALKVIREELNLTDADILEEMETEPQS